MNKLLRKDTPWEWTQECSDAFKEAKQRLVSSHVLVHYDSNLPIVLAGDASAYGIGAVISHITPDGHEHPIDSIRLTDVVEQRAELRTGRKRGTVPNLWCEEVQLLTVWQKVLLSKMPIPLVVGPNMNYS